MMTDSWKNALSAFNAPTELQCVKRQAAIVDNICQRMQDGLELQECRPLARVVNAVRQATTRNSDIYASLLKQLLTAVTVKNRKGFFRVDENSAICEWLSALGDVLKDDSNCEVHKLACHAIVQALALAKRESDAVKFFRDSGVVAGLLLCLRKCKEAGSNASALIETLVRIGSTHGMWNSLFEEELLLSVSTFLENNKENWSHRNIAIYNAVSVLSQACMWILLKCKRVETSLLATSEASDSMAAVFAEFIHTQLSSSLKASLRPSDFLMIWDHLLVLHVLARDGTFCMHLWKLEFSGLALRIFDHLVRAVDASRSTSTKEHNCKQADCLRLLCMSLARMCDIECLRKSVVDCGFQESLISIISLDDKGLDSAEKHLLCKQKEAAMYLLCRILDVAEIPDVEIPWRQLLEFLKSPDREEMRTMSLSLLNCLVGRNSLSICDEDRKGLIKSLIASFGRHPSQGAAILLTKLCKGICVRQVVNDMCEGTGRCVFSNYFHNQGGVAPVMTELESMTTSCPVEPSAYLLSLLQLVLDVVIPEKESVMQLIEEKGVETLLDILDRTHDLYRSQTLTVLAELLVSADEAKKVFYQWRSRSHGRSALTLLLDIWTDSCEENDHHLQKVHTTGVYGNLTQCNEALRAAMEKENTAGILQRKLYTICSILGPDATMAITPSDAHRLLRIQQYETRENLEILIEIQQKVTADRINLDEEESSRLESLMSVHRKALHGKEEEAEELLKEEIRRQDLAEKHEYQLLVG